MNDPVEGIAEGQWTTGTVARITPLGVIVRLPGSREGLLYKQDIYERLEKGNAVKVYITKIREDGKIDLALTKGGYKHFIDSATEIIMQELSAAGGFIAVTDKSDPALIARKFRISKKKFKEAVGALYKARKLTIEDAGIRLLAAAHTQTPPPSAPGSLLP